MKAILGRGLLAIGLAAWMSGCVEQGFQAESNWTAERVVAADRTEGRATRLERPLRSGERVFVAWRGSFWPATTLAVRDDGRARVRYQGYGPAWDELAPPQRIMRELPHRDEVRVSEQVYVSWRGSYWPARIVGLRPGGRVAIAYEGYGPEWDEAVGLERIKWFSAVPVTTPARPAPLAVGDKIQVEWGGHYYPATVLALQEANLVRIHYEGYGPEWDEVVGPDRIATP
jgi:hypothetical protein